jgi:hypothetical protein
MSQPTSISFRELCAELANELQGYKAANPMHCRELLDRARAALAQPEPQGPTDEELLELMPETMRDEFSYASQVCSDATGGQVKPGIFRVCLNRTALEYARAVLTRWGRPAIEPVPVTERLPGPEDCLGRPFEETDAGFCWWFYPGLDGWRFMMAVRWVDGAYQKWTPPGTTHWLPHYALPVPQQQEVK